MRAFGAVPLLVLLFASTQKPWEGEWITDLGLMTLTQDGARVTGRYGDNGQVEGTVEGRKLSARWKRGAAAGEASFELAEDGTSFKGTWKGGGDAGTWHGWKRDPNAERARPANFAGVWLWSWGTMQLEQKGLNLKGPYGAQGWGTVEGVVRGRRVRLKWKRLEWSGEGWIEQTADGKRFFGMSEGDEPEVWLGLRLTGFDLHEKAKAGDVVEGRAKNGMLYFLRMPKGWAPGRPVDVVVLLHGSNWTTKGMVHVTAKSFPEVANRFAILGIQGERWASWSDLDDLRFNYTYVNWMGRSTYKGYPYTDRESPYLVAQVLDELKKVHNFGRVFVGGHSQGGFLAYILHMHYPEKWAGTFPMAGGLVIQAEPDVFKDPALLSAQRATPLAIVHGKLDDVVEFSTGQYAHERFLASGFPLLRLFAPESGHPFDFLPVGEVVEWLDALSTKDVAVLAGLARKRAEAGAWRDVAAALARAKALGSESKLAEEAKLLDQAAKKDAARHLVAIRKNAGNSWVDDYLAWQDEFEFAPAARETVEAYRKLQATHDAPAEKLIEEARKAFRSGSRNVGYEKYQEVIEKYYAAKQYRIVKRWLEKRE